MKLLFSSNISWSVYNFRADLLKTLKKNGFDVHVTASRDDYSSRLIDLGFTFHELGVKNNATNPIEDFFLIFKYYFLYKKIKPDIILHNAIKPNIYGTIAAGILGIPTINNISGLGTLFIKRSFSTRIAKFLYWFSQKFAKVVFFQNPYDRDLFLKEKLISKHIVDVIPGSGVDTERFKPFKNTDRNTSNLQCLFVGRLLVDKGILEFVGAAKLLKQKYPNVDFNILGPFYEDNSTTISKTSLEDWLKEGFVRYLGTTDYVEEVFSKNDFLVLPSYREGLSKVLIEASSMALPIVTTNVPGCKDVVIDGVTGYLCAPKSTEDLALKIEKMIKLNNIKRMDLGLRGRKRAKEVFDVKIIIDKYLNTIEKVLQ